MEDIKISLGKRIRDLRKQREFSQEELGGKAGLHFTYIGAIERGEKSCSIVTLEKISKGLGINIRDLFNIPSHESDINKLKKEIQEKISESSPQVLVALREMIRLLEMNK